MNHFDEYLQKNLGTQLLSDGIQILQVNIGLFCNQQCVHCHLDSGPQRTEVMEWETIDWVLQAARVLKPELVDITGGSPEFNHHLKEFINALCLDGIQVQTRTNLTALLEPGMEDMPKFFKEHNVHLVASLPCYLEENVCKQRGDGTYKKSIKMLQKLNSLGYGYSQELPLHLVYNPGGPFLPQDQAELEKDYKRELFNQFKVKFNKLLTMTNMPIGRFLENLKRQEQASDYMQLLMDSFNPQTVDGLMCRHQLNVSWDGTLYDCDFNLALRLSLEKNMPQHIKDFKYEYLLKRKIRTGDHCFGCTAGFGSSCGGSLSSSAPA